MTQENRPDINLDPLFNEAKNQSVPSENLIARVLGDAANIGATYAPAPPAQITKIRWPFLAPIFGAPGLVTLGLCAIIGLGAGLGNAEVLYQIPGMEQVIALIGSDAPPENPFYTLELLMTES